MKAIESSRTSDLNAHIHTCRECGHEIISYNSCRNRHCPLCQDFKREQWLNKQEQSLLLIHYFHVVFTLLSIDPKHLGANIGFSTILHTWGQNLMFHPHLH